MPSAESRHRFSLHKRGVSKAMQWSGHTPCSSSNTSAGHHTPQHCMSAPPSAAQNACRCYVAGGPHAPSSALPTWQQKHMPAVSRGFAQYRLAVAADADLVVTCTTTTTTTLPRSQGASLDGRVAATTIRRVKGTQHTRRAPVVHV